MSRRSGLAMMTLIVGAICISFASPLAKLAAQDGDMGWIATAFWRVAIAMPLLWMMTLRSRATRATATKAIVRGWAVLLIPGVFFAFDLLTWHLSFAWTTAASATLLANLGVVIVGFVSWRWLSERLDGRYVLGAAVALGGVAWLLFGTSSPAEHPFRLRGDLLAISTAVFYASYILAMKVLRTHHGALLLMAVATTTSTVLLFVAAMLSGESLLPASAQAWLWLVLLAIVPHCLGQGFIVLSLSALPASFAAVTLLLQPVATAVWGWLFLNELLGPWQIAAGILVITGIVLARLGSGGAIQCPPSDDSPPTSDDCGAASPRQPTQ